MTADVCRFNKNGFCKFGEECRNRHVREICGVPQCGEQECVRRHPRPCRFFASYGSCRFGDDCAYLHKVKKDDAVVELEHRVAAAEERIRALEDLIRQMEDDSKREVDEEYDIMMKDESSLESDEEYDNEDDAAEGEDENDVQDEDQETLPLLKNFLQTVGRALEHERENMVEKLLDKMNSVDVPEGLLDRLEARVDEHMGTPAPRLATGARRRQARVRPHHRRGQGGGS